MHKIDFFLFLRMQYKYSSFVFLNENNKKIHSLKYTVTRYNNNEYMVCGFVLYLFFTMLKVSRERYIIENKESRVYGKFKMCKAYMLHSFSKKNKL